LLLAFVKFEPESYVFITPISQLIICQHPLVLKLSSDLDPISENPWYLHSEGRDHIVDVFTWPNATHPKTPSVEGKWMEMVASRIQDLKFPGQGQNKDRRYQKGAGRIGNDNNDNKSSNF